MGWEWDPETQEGKAHPVVNSKLPRALGRQSSLRLPYAGEHSPFPGDLQGPPLSQVSPSCHQSLIPEQPRGPGLSLA